jgi:hypothetical protein
LSEAIIENNLSRIADLSTTITHNYRSGVVDHELRLTKIGAEVCPENAPLHQ